MENISLPGTPDELENLAKLRMNICKKCPLYKNKYLVFPICNSNLYLNPKTNDVSTSPKDGYIRGCGCSLEYRTNNPKIHCVCGKW